ncbi:MAG: hypothetical protein KA007_01595 [Candidatus Pacebacteria bacterium]|nr:hypothetical protein [Candidatus Paceibacterota bacterium]
MRIFLYVYIGVVVTILVVTGFLVVRLPKDDLTHIHANFGVFVSGQKLDFSGEKYMHVKPCFSNYHTQKHFGERVHLHDGIGDVAHIHDSGVVWGDLMLYLGVKTTSNGIEFDEKLHAFGKQDKLSYYINGKSVNDFELTEINNNDSLIIILDNENLSDFTVSKEKFNQLSSLLSNRSEELNSLSLAEACGGAYEMGFWEKVAKVWGF